MPQFLNATVTIPQWLLLSITFTSFICSFVMYMLIFYATERTMKARVIRDVTPKIAKKESKAIKRQEPIIEKPIEKPKQPKDDSFIVVRKGQ